MTSMEINLICLSRNFFDALSEEREEITAKYRKDLDRLEDEYYKRRKAENSQV